MSQVAITNGLGMHILKNKTDYNYLSTLILRLAEKPSSVRGFTEISGGKNVLK